MRRDLPDTGGTRELWLCFFIPDTPPERAAALAYEWTPRVSLTPDGEVLAEIGGSARLFGGVGAIRTAVERVTPRFAAAPTPQAALWLARGTPGAWVGSRARLAGALARVPVAALGLDETVVERLAGFGVRRLGQLSRLPRAALARRTGVALNQALARAHGERPDPRATWSPPPTYSARLDLDHETTSAATLVQAAAPLFEGLTVRLRESGHGVRRCTLVFAHVDTLPTRVRIGTLEAVADPGRLCAQFALWLERAPVPAAVRAIALYASRFEPMPGAARDLFARHSGEGWTAVIERLQGRLGEHAVFAVRPHADHRPERAWSKESRRIASLLQVPIPTVGATQCVATRPVWLLHEPRPVDPHTYAIERGPERIESGWWDDADTMRDYFVAHDRRGTRCWLFRDRRAPHGWFLHGLFG